MDQSRQWLIYGHDDRREPFEFGNPLLAVLAQQSVVALGSRSMLAFGASGVQVDALSWRARNGLCDGPLRYASQPAFAVCTGVALAPDLVVTASHCARAVELSDLAVVEGFYNVGPDVPRPLRRGDVHAVAEVVTEDWFLDLTWLRISPPVTPLPREALAHPTVDVGMSVVAAGHGGGIPLKLDDGGRVLELDERGFVANIDAFGGLSGGAVFSERGELLGVVTSGGTDYDIGPEGCLEPMFADDNVPVPGELVVDTPRLVEPVCGEIDGAQCSLVNESGESQTLSGGCALAPLSSTSGRNYMLLALLALGLIAWRRHAAASRASATRLGRGGHALSAAEHGVGAYDLGTDEPTHGGRQRGMRTSCDELVTRVHPSDVAAAIQRLTVRGLTTLSQAISRALCPAAQLEEVRPATLR